MTLSNIKNRIKEMAQSDAEFELTESIKLREIKVGRLRVFGLPDGHFAAADVETGVVEYFATRNDAEPALFAAQIEALFEERLKTFTGPLVSASYVYVFEADNPQFKAHLKAKRDDFQHLSSFDVTWIKAPTAAFTQMAFKRLYKTGTRYLIMGPREHEIEPVGPNFVRRKDPDNWHVNMRSDFIEINALGSTHEAFYYSSNYKNGVIRVPISHPKAHILTLAPMKYWEDMGIFWRKGRDGKSHLDFEAIRNYLMSLSAEMGEYTLVQMLSSGYYYNPESERCYARSGFITYGAAPKDVIHAYGRPIYVPKSPESKVQIKLLCEIFDSFCWSEPYMGRVLLGWVLLAPFSGALKFRPHCWINGETSAGKTWIFENVVCPLLGSLYCGFTMGTTEAGLIRGLEGMALPVVHDEFESDQDFKKSAKMSLIEFFRGCSTSAGDNMSIKKGMQGSANTVQSFKSACMVLLGSIRNCLETPQDSSRFLVLDLDKQKRKPEFKKIRDICEKDTGNLHNIFKVHVDTAFHNFKMILHHIKRWEDKLKEQYPDLNHHSARCIAGINGMLKFYDIEIENVEKMVDKFENYAISEADNILDHIFFQQFWYEGQRKNLLYYVRGAARRVGQEDTLYGPALRIHGMTVERAGARVDLYISVRNRAFNFNIVKPMGVRNWLSLLTNDHRIKAVNSNKIVIKDVFSYIGGLNEDTKRQAADEA